jgi:hypothetical protein
VVILEVLLSSWCCFCRYMELKDLYVLAEKELDADKVG